MKDKDNTNNNVLDERASAENGSYPSRNGARYSAAIRNSDHKKCNSYFIIFNPPGTMKNIYISRVVHTNNSKSCVMVDCYCNCNNTVPRNAWPVTCYSNNNTAYCNCHSCARVYRGYNLPFIKNCPELVYSVPCCENFINRINGTIILAPGSYYMEVTRDIDSCGCGCQYSSISWWEEPTECVGRQIRELVNDIIEHENSNNSGTANQNQQQNAGRSGERSLNENTGRNFNGSTGTSFTPDPLVENVAQPVVLSPCCENKCLCECCKDRKPCGCENKCPCKCCKDNKPCSCKNQSPCGCEKETPLFPCRPVEKYRPLSPSGSENSHPPVYDSEENIFLIGSDSETHENSFFQEVLTEEEWLKINSHE